MLIKELKDKEVQLNQLIYSYRDIFYVYEYIPCMGSYLSILNEEGKREDIFSASDEMEQIAAFLDGAISMAKYLNPCVGIDCGRKVGQSHPKDDYGNKGGTYGDTYGEDFDRNAGGTY